MQLQNKVAIVTGASREIGAAMAEALAAAGAAVLVVHYAEPERAAAVVERIAASGGRALAHDADLSSVAANQQMIARAVEAFGRLDILAANAGLTIFKPFLETDEASWDTLFDLNLKGSFFGAQAAARQMIARGQGGRIVFSSSVTGVQAAPNLGAYIWRARSRPSWVSTALPSTRSRSARPSTSATSRTTRSMPSIGGASSPWAARSNQPTWPAH